MRTVSPDTFLGIRPLSPDRWSLIAHRLDDGLLYHVSGSASGFWAVDVASLSVTPIGLSGDTVSRANWPAPRNLVQL